MILSMGTRWLHRQVSANCAPSAAWWRRPPAMRAYSALSGLNSGAARAERQGRGARDADRRQLDADVGQRRREVLRVRRSAWSSSVQENLSFRLCKRLGLKLAISACILRVSPLEVRAECYGTHEASSAGLPDGASWATEESCGSSCRQCSAEVARVRIMSA